VVAIGVAAFEFLMPASRQGAVTPVAQTENTTPSLQASPTVVPALAPQSVDPVPAATVKANPAAPAVPTVARQAAQIAPSRPAVEPATSASSTAVDSVRVRLEFNEASWVEVYDAAGQRLVYDVGQPGRPRSVVGAAPLSVVVGLASAVSVQVNDKAILVPRRANRDSTRFSIGADGVVQ
jgi:cytoskeleton protein RodZ